MLVNITNRTTSVRSFQAGGRYLTLAGGEVERNVNVSKEEAEALNATSEFYVREVEAAPIGLASGEHVMAASRAAKPASDDSKTTLKP